jgi:hypothetical protein
MPSSSAALPAASLPASRGAARATRGRTAHSRAAPAESIRFRLTVKDVVPEIWREFLVPPHVTLETLHSIIQVLMGWEKKHLYAFTIGEKRYMSASDVDDAPSAASRSTGATLARALAGTGEMLYEYDFGDNWHVALSRLPLEAGLARGPATGCIGGSRRGPVEDSGGARGYVEKSRIYTNPHHKQYAMVRRLFGPGFDAEAFDLVKINRELGTLGGR